MSLIILFLKYGTLISFECSLIYLWVYEIELENALPFFTKWRYFNYILWIAYFVFFLCYYQMSSSIQC